MLKKAVMAMAAPKHVRATGEIYDHERPTHERLGQAFAEYVARYPADKLPHAGGINATVVVTMDLSTLLGGLKSATIDTGGHLVGRRRPPARVRGRDRPDGPRRRLPPPRRRTTPPLPHRTPTPGTGRDAEALPTPHLRRPGLAVPRPPPDPLDPRRQDQHQGRPAPLPPPPHPRPPRPTDPTDADVRRCNRDSSVPVRGLGDADDGLIAQPEATSTSSTSVSSPASA